MYYYADYAIGGLNRRNNIQNIRDFKLNGIITDCFRSIFLYDENLKIFVDKTGSISGYDGKHISDALLFDFDGEDLEQVKKEVYNFIMYLYHTYEVPFEYLRIAFSGSKGFHVSIPMTAICDPQPDDNFHKIYKSIAEDLYKDFRFIDSSIYEPKRLFRMTNTINSKTGLYKIPLHYDELELSIDEIKKIAEKPRSIELLPLSEISQVSALNELYNKWLGASKIPLKSTSKRSELLSVLQSGSTEGNRHNSVIRLTRALQERGLDYDFILEILKIWNERNNPPLDERRLEQESRRVFNDNALPEETPEILNLKQAKDKYELYINRLNQCKVKTGYENIDNKIRGLMPGETMCILGKTSVGKSAFLQNIGLNYAKSSKEPVLFFSMEMPVTSVYERTLQIETGLSGYEIERSTLENDIEMESKANLIIGQLPNFFIITKSGLNLQHIHQFIKFAEDKIYKKQTGLVLIDYLGLVRGSGKDLYEQTSRVARGIKDLAKELNVPIIFLSQVTKQFTEFDELQINSARDSGSVDEASDFVLALWKEKDKRPIDEQTDIPQMLGILKNRKGGLGKVKIEMQKRSLKMTERDDYV